jgi:hypothetical protein
MSRTAVATRNKLATKAANAAKGVVAMATRGRPRNEPISVDKNWFSQRFGALRMSARQVAAALSTDAAILHRLIQGSRKAQLSEAVALANLLEADLTEVAARLGYPVQRTGPLIVGAVVKGGVVTRIHPAIGRNAEPVAPAAGRMRALKVDAGDKGLAAYEGATLFYDDTSGTGLPASALDRLCVVEITGDVAPVVGTVSKGPGRGLQLRTIAGETRDASQIHRACVVTAIIFG